MLDALPTLPQTAGQATTDHGLPLIEWIKVVANIATVLIALVNVAFAVYFFWRKDKKEDKDKTRDIRLDWFKSLILDYTMANFYSFFENVEGVMSSLTGNKVTDADKKNAEAEILAEQIRLRKKFTDTLLAVDASLYQNVMDATDSLTDQLNATIFDPGINLAHRPKFEETVLQPISETRTDILKRLFAYDGS